GYKLSAITSQTFFTTTYRLEWLPQQLLLGGQPANLSRPPKRPQNPPPVGPAGAFAAGAPPPGDLSAPPQTPPGVRCRAAGAPRGAAVRRVRTGRPAGDRPADRPGPRRGPHDAGRPLGLLPAAAGQPQGPPGPAPGADGARGGGGGHRPGVLVPAGRSRRSA